MGGIEVVGSIRMTREIETLKIFKNLNGQGLKRSRIEMFNY